MILETDSPYLSTTPFRGERNEPKNIFEIAKKLSLIKDCDIKDIARVTTTNCHKLFNL